MSGREATEQRALSGPQRGRARRVASALSGLVALLLIALAAVAALLLVAAAAVGLCLGLAWLVRYEILGDLTELGVSGSVVSALSLLIAISTVVAIGWTISRNDEIGSGWSLLRRSGRGRHRHPPAEGSGGIDKSAGAELEPRADGSDAAIDEVPENVARIRVGGEIVNVEKMVVSKAFAWFVREAFGLTWTVHIDVYEARIIESAGSERPEPALMGLLELNGGSAAEIGRLKRRQQAVLEINVGGRILAVIDDKTQTKAR